MLGGVGLLVVAGGAYYYSAEKSLALPSPEAEAALKSDSQVSITDGDFLVFQPRGKPPLTGLIFYPGASCDVRGYAPVLRRIAAEGYLVIGVQMPLHMAIFAPNRAQDVRTAFPLVQNWVIAGHSMGGAMAAHYAHNHANDLAGLILWDSRPAEMDTLVALKYPVWHIHRATAAGRAPEKLERFRQFFPSSSTWVPIPGGIHMYFGSFTGGAYREEWTPYITREAHQNRAVQATLDALLQMASPPNMNRD